MAVPLFLTSAGAYNTTITITGGGGATVQAIGHTATPDTSTLPGVIRINEVVSNNVSGLQDEDGSHEDWIEIYNGTVSDIDLENWKLKDDDTGTWTFPDITLPSGETMVVFFSGPGNARPPLPGKYLHTGFNLDTDGGYVKLVDDSNVLKSEVTYPALTSNFSFSYYDVISGFAHRGQATACEFSN